MMGRMSRVQATRVQAKVELAELVEHGLSEASPALQAHLGRCASCCAALAGTIGSASDASAALPESSLASDGPTLASGSFVGRYQVEHLLASGAMGDVYIAFDPELERRVAVKVLRSQDSDKAEDLGHRCAEKRRRWRSCRTPTS